MEWQVLLLLLRKAKIFHGSLKKEMTSEDLPENSSWDSIMTTVVALTDVRGFITARLIFEFHY